MDEDGTQTLVPGQGPYANYLGKLSHLKAVDFAVDWEGRPVIDYALTHKLVEGCEGSFFTIIWWVKN